MLNAFENTGLSDFDQAILKTFPNNKKALRGLASVPETAKTTAAQATNLEQLKILQENFNRGNFSKVITQAQLSIKAFPNNFEVWNILGISFAKLGKPDLAVDAFKRVTVLNPNDHNGFNNLGNSLKDQGKYDEAIQAFKQAISKKPRFFEAYFNYGNALKAKRDFNTAIDKYKQVLEIEPTHLNACLNMGESYKELDRFNIALDIFYNLLSYKPNHAGAQVSIAEILSKQGNSREAIKTLKKALNQNPNSAKLHDAMASTLLIDGRLEDAKAHLEKSLSLKFDLETLEIFYGLCIQLNSKHFKISNVLKHEDHTLSLKLTQSPKYQIYQAIEAYLLEDFHQARTSLENYGNCNLKDLEALSKKNSIFCMGYQNFLQRLLIKPIKSHQSDSHLVYHIGESHCLSYAHQKINLNNKKHKIKPLITFGGKAFHFSKKGSNKFKEITKQHLCSVPKSSQIFVSFGEIDCRAGEGFLRASERTQNSIEKIIINTVKRYINWFEKENKIYNHTLYFFNVPAPVYNQNIDLNLNSNVAKVVSLFNIELKKQVEIRGLKLVDVYKYTVDINGFSNGLFHIDKWHLGDYLLTEVEKQINVNY